MQQPVQQGRVIEGEVVRPAPASRGQSLMPQAEEGVLEDELSVDTSGWGFHEQRAVLDLEDALLAGDEGKVRVVVELLRRQAMYTTNSEFRRWVRHLDKYFPGS